MKCQLSDLKKKNICTYISKKLWCCSRSVFMSLNFLKSGNGSKHGTPFGQGLRFVFIMKGRDLITNSQDFVTNGEYFHDERSRFP